MRFSRGGEPRIVTRDASNRCRKCARAFSLRNPEIINNRVESQRCLSFLVKRGETSSSTRRRFGNCCCPWHCETLVSSGQCFRASMMKLFCNGLPIDIFLPSFWKLKNQGKWIRLKMMIGGWWKMLIHYTTVSFQRRDD